MAIDTKVKQIDITQLSFVTQGETNGRFWAMWTFDEDGENYFVTNKEWHKAMLDGNVINLTLKSAPQRYYVDKDGKRLPSGTDRSLRAKNDNGTDKVVESEVDVQRNIMAVRTFEAAEKVAKIKAKAKNLEQLELIKANTELLDVKIAYRTAVTKAAESAVMTAEQKAAAEAMLADDF